MSDNNGGMSCSLGCWLLAAGVGLLTAILLKVIGHQGWMASIFLGGVAFALLGLLFSWLFCAPLPKLGEVKPVSAAAHKPAAAPTAKPVAKAAPVAEAPKPAPAPAPAAEAPKAEAAPAAEAPKAEAAAPAAATAGGEVVKASAKLAGEEDLDSRKGSWTYENANAGKAGATQPVEPPSRGASSPAAATAPAAAAPAPAAEGPGTKPATLSEARAGGADDLKRIKGIGPKLEKLCHTLGFYHFDQIAAWTADEVAWVDQNLEGFKGRVTRDEWVAQAKLLAAGGETAFSKKVDKGDVY